MTTPTQELREQVARIIDPSSWRVMDGYLADMKRQYAGQDAGYDPDSFKHKESLAKADAILALPPLSPGAGVVEALRAKGNTLLAALAVNGWPVSDEHWRNSSGLMSHQARALHLASTDFKAALRQAKDPTQ